MDNETNPMKSKILRINNSTSKLYNWVIFMLERKQIESEIEDIVSKFPLIKAIQEKKQERSQLVKV